MLGDNFLWVEAFDDEDYGRFEFIGETNDAFFSFNTVPGLDSASEVASFSYTMGDKSKSDDDSAQGDDGKTGAGLPQGALGNGG